MSTTRIKNVIYESEASVSHSLAVAEQTRQTSVDMAETLQQQGEKLKNTEESVDRILYRQHEAERHISTTESNAGWLTSKLHFRRNKLKHTKTDNKNHTTTNNSPHDVVKVKSPIDMQEPIDYDLLNTDDKSSLKNTNLMLDKIGDVMDDLKKDLLQQGEEIDAHNARLPRLQNKVVKAEATMDVQILRIKRTF